MYLQFAAFSYDDVEIFFRFRNVIFYKMIYFDFRIIRNVQIHYGILKTPPETVDSYCVLYFIAMTAFNNTFNKIFFAYSFRNVFPRLIFNKFCRATMKQLCNFVNFRLARIANTIFPTLYRLPFYSKMTGNFFLS